MKRFLILAAASLFSLSCSLVDDSDTFTAPTLEDIPYDALGNGTLAFMRIFKDGTNGLYVIDASSRSTYSIDGTRMACPALSPDGSRFAHLSRHSEFEYRFWDVYVSDHLGLNQERVSMTSGSINCPAWTPDGRHIVFDELEPELGKYVHQIPWPLSRGSAIVHSVGENRAIPENRLSISPAGSAIYPSGLAFFYVFNLSTGELRQIPLPGRTYATLEAPAWSPDGRHIAYFERVDLADSLRTHLKIMDADGGSVVTAASFTRERGGVAWSERNLNAVAWSPDGSMIAFPHQERELEAHIYVVGRDGEGLRQVTSATGVTDHSLSWVP